METAMVWPIFGAPRTTWTCRCHDVYFTRAPDSDLSRRWAVPAPSLSRPTRRQDPGRGDSRVARPAACRDRGRGGAGSLGQGGGHGQRGRLRGGGTRRRVSVRRAPLKLVFADTGGFYALVDRQDPAHRQIGRAHV